METAKPNTEAPPKDGNPNVEITILGKIFVNEEKYFQSERILETLKRLKKSIIIQEIEANASGK